MVNLFGGAGAGKSTTRAGVFHRLKLAGIVCEEAFEWIKYKVYEGNTYAPTDQLYILAKQRKTLREIGDQVQVIITDSPILLSAIYDAEKNPLFQQLVLQEFKKFNNLNFVVERVKPFSAVGRYGDEEDAQKYDQKIEQYLHDNGLLHAHVAGDEKAAEVIAAITRRKLEGRWPV
ncbi:AAA family ATPase [Anaeroselena agilis]|uniref:NadR/Ttd14 AAA domain-containing protein n=1 Tax=Anaeroselena agilis TaxID=3063788 RepID=A0ABU3NXR7_9FIRM|nr:hypothetical protein [Selenomonadales bacterium 4137-cl]